MPCLKLLTLGLLLLSSACSSTDDTTNAATTAGPGASSSASSSGAGGAGGSSGATGGGGGVYMPPPAHAACDAPAATVLGTWTAANGERFGSVRLAWTGAEAAIAYAESSGANAWTVKLQRLLEDGTTKGPRILVGAATGNFAPRVALAASDAGYVACWDGAASGLACAAIPLSAGDAKAGLSASGLAPALAFGPGGWALVYAPADALVAQRLGDDAKAVGAAVPIANAKAPIPVIASTPSGFAVGYGNVEVQRLDAALAPSGAKIHVATSPSGLPLLGFGASGEKIGLAWDDTSEVGFSMIDAANAPTARQKIDAPAAMPSYGQIAVAGALDSFAVGWSAYEGFLDYRAIEGAGAPIGTVAQPFSTDWDDNPVAIVAVSDGFLAASATGIAADTMKVGHLACP